jgi:parvulin-like peptidyl-prolyl isomerase
VAVSALAVVVAIGLLVFAWWDQNIRPRTELAIRVGDRSYNMEYWARRFQMAYDDPANASDAQSGFTTTLRETTSSDIETEAVLLQRADQLGISAGENEIDKEMLVRNNVAVVTDTPEGQEASPDDPLQLTPGMANVIRAQLQRYGLTLEQYREIYHAGLLRQKAEQHFTDQQPARAPQAKVRVLQFPSESDSRIAIQKIQSGEASFEELAESVSLDQAGKGVGGARDWLPRGVLPPALEEAAFSLPLNTLSEPLDSGLPNGWFVMRVDDRSDERDVSEAVRKEMGRRQLQAWIDEQRQSLGVTNNVTADHALWADEFLNIRAAASTPAGLPAGLPNIPVQPLPAPAPAPGAAPAAPPAAPDAAPPPPASNP